MKNKIAQLFGYYLDDETTIKQMLMEMDQKGKLDRRTLVDIIQVLIDKVEEMDNEIKTLTAKQNKPSKSKKK